MSKTKKPGEYHTNDVLSELIQKASPEGKNQIIDFIDSGVKEYKRSVREHNEETAAHFINQVIDEQVKKEMTTKADLIEEKGGIKCKKGCYYCCEQHVGISLDEALLMLDYIEDQKIEVDWKKIGRQAKIKNPEDWYKQQRKDWTCAMLGEDKLCKVYKHRPHTCRKYLVVSDPENCNTEGSEFGHVKNVARFVTPTAELFMASAWNAVNDVDSIPKQLLKAKKLRKKRE